MKLNQFISQTYADRARELFRQYDQADPFRHLVMDDFFDADFARQLLEEFPPFDVNKAMNENGEIGAKCVHEEMPRLGASYRALDGLVQSTEFLEWLGRMTGIDGLQYDPDYFGGGTHENRHGQDLDPHVDFNKHPQTGMHRRLNLIIYLNREWSDDWGGAIELHKDPRLPPEQDTIRYVNPKFNRAVLFETTHWSWHGFERINLPQGDADPHSRKSVALYFYSESRPKEEQTKPHSTIYVERPLPAHIQPGMTLSEEDHRRITTLLARRDQHLQRLYGNISDLSAHNEDLIRQRNQAVDTIRKVESYAESSEAGWRGLLRRARFWLARKLL